MDVTGDRVVGALASSALPGSSVSNCYVTGSVKVADMHDEVAGGLIGRMCENTSLSNCYLDASVAAFERVGGLVGEAEGRITGSYFTGSVNDGVEGGQAGVLWGSRGVAWSKTAIQLATFTLLGCRRGRKSPAISLVPRSRKSAWRRKARSTEGNPAMLPTLQPFQRSFP
ncbi:hypothetical protein AKJ39_04770 [candidate division MSBL1 archaeon SCGC-AAA259J03]|uniref:GLUG domain-containing protein n=1 Tax=candidate division MSBL1 archaeon SCGC-AAA259J03 TaxID=1698269 RepID=A0A656YUM4_9EURY|nr:hypothetical protein AKJ39_04770 [candidate division MSBL1 archaeon SCGC-AAA259J03]